MCKTFLETLLSDFSIKPSAIYRHLNMSRQNFNGRLRATTNYPTLWPKIRQAMGISKREFWRRAMQYYDPD